jgi:hypothetical protein
VESGAIPEENENKNGERQINIRVWLNTKSGRGSGAEHFVSRARHQGAGALFALYMGGERNEQFP